MSRTKLNPSPLTTLRCLHGLSMAEAGEKLGMTTLCVARIEERTQRIPIRTRRCMAKALTPPAERVTQLTIFDFLSELEAGDGRG